MRSNLTRNKVSPKSHKKIVAFVYADVLTKEDVPKIKYYLERRKDLHFIYAIVSQIPDDSVQKLADRYKHIKLIVSENPENEIAKIKAHFNGTEVIFRDRKFEDLKDRSL